MTMELLPLLLLFAPAAAQLGRNPNRVGVRNVEGVKLVIMGMTHGTINPTEFLESDPNDEDDWFEDVPGELNVPGEPKIRGQGRYTKFGELQAWTVGRTIRERYPDLLKRTFDPSEILAYSSSTDSTRNTARIVMEALYSTAGDYASFLQRPPSSTRFNIREDQRLLQIRNANCGSSRAAWEEVIRGGQDLPHVRTWYDLDRLLVDYVGTAVNRKPPNLDVITNVVDNIHGMKYTRLAYPTWVQTPNASLGMDRFTLLEQLKKFEKAAGAACANHAPCRKIMAGYWLGSIVELLKRAVAGTLNENVKLVTFTSHTEVVYSLMRLLDYTKPERVLTPSSGFIIEFRETAYPEIRFLTHEAVEFVPTQREIKLAERQPQCRVSGTIIEWCPLAEVLRTLSDRLINDIDAACRTSPDQLTAIDLISLSQSGEFTNSIFANWALAAGDANKVSRYELTISPVGDRAASQTYSANGGASSFRFEGLDSGSAYTVEVLAVGNNGLSDSIEEIMTTSSISLVEIISLFQTVFGTDRIKVMWAVDPEQEANVREYIVQINPSVDPTAAKSQTVDRSINMLLFENLTPGTSYDIAVVAVTDSGRGATRRGVFLTNSTEITDITEVTEITDRTVDIIDVPDPITCAVTEPIEIISIDKIKSDSAGLLLGWAVLPGNVGKVQYFEMFLTPLSIPDFPISIDVNEAQFTKLIPALDPETIYNVTIRAKTICGPEHPAHTVWIITDRFDTYDAPPLPPPPPEYERPPLPPPPPEYERPPLPPPPTEYERPPPSTPAPPSPAPYDRWEPPPRPQPRPAPYAQRPRPPPISQRPSQKPVTQRPRPTRPPPSYYFPTNPPSYTSPPVTVRPTTRDSRSLCPEWAKAGHCERNPFFMKPNCQLSCECCGCTSASIAKVDNNNDCFDFNEDCPFWAVAGECKKNDKFMRNVCPASCRRCRTKA